MTILSATELRRAAAVRDKIDTLQAKLIRIFGHAVGNGLVGNEISTPKKGRRRKMSAAGRARIAAAARARWKKAKAAGKNTL